MHCCKCDSDLAECICPDAAERIEIVLNSQFLALGREYQERLIAHAERCKNEQVTKE